MGSFHFPTSYSSHFLPWITICNDLQHWLISCLDRKCWKRPILWDFGVANVRPLITVTDGCNVRSWTSSESKQETRMSIRLKFQNSSSWKRMKWVTSGHKWWSESECQWEKFREAERHDEMRDGKLDKTRRHAGWKVSTNYSLSHHSLYLATDYSNVHIVIINKRANEISCKRATTIQNCFSENNDGFLV